MEIKATLKKPYIGTQKADFIVLYNHNKDYEIKETADGLEAWGLTAEEQEEQALENRKKSMRGLRNQYLVDYVDPYQLVIRWGTLSKTEQGYLIEYRQYLLDYTNDENWWNNEPDTYEAWLLAHHPVVEEE